MSAAHSGLRPVLRPALRPVLRPVLRLATVGTACLGLLITTGQVASAHESQDQTFADQRVVELTGVADQSGAASGLRFHQTHAEHVTATNLAVAHTACDGCRAVTLSFQVVVADRGPASLDVANLALAVNEDCTGCESLAVAYQLVVATDDRARLAAGGQQQLAQLRRDLRELSRSDLPLEQVQARAEALMGEVTTAVAANLRVRPQVRCDHDLHRKAAPVTSHGRGHDSDHDHGSGYARGHGADASDA